MRVKTKEKSQKCIEMEGYNGREKGKGKKAIETDGSVRKESKGKKEG